MLLVLLVSTSCSSPATEVAGEQLGPDREEDNLPWQLPPAKNLKEEKKKQDHQR